MTDPIRILFASDLHFGKPSIDQDEMAKSFALTVFPLLSETDIFFINGDFFDTVVNFDHYGFDAISNTIFDLFALCEDHKVILRVLQGTWEHDRNQCRRLENFYRNGRFTFDFRFAKGIELEEIWVRNRDLRFFFVPDDLPFTSSDDIVDVIRNKMVEIGWDHADYGCMHGFFDFTCGNMPQANAVVYKETQFPFVTKMIDVGHVHQHRISGKVISNGSFDRLVFGDEDPKGLIQVMDYPDRYTARFIENKTAAVWDSLVFTDNDTTETVRERITNHVASLHSDRKISLRILVNSFELKDAIKSWMKDVYPDIALKFKKVSESDKQSLMIPSSELLTTVEKRSAPTPETIGTHIRAHIPESYPLTIEKIDAYLEKPLDKV